MSRIDDLIAKQCPNGVEFKKLEKVCDIANNKRKPVESSLRISGQTPYYGANNIQDYVEGFTHEGNYVLIAEDGSASLENYSIQYTEGKFWANNHVHVIKRGNELNNRFLFHYLRSMNFRPFLSGGERAKLTKAKMIEIKIPVPPLSIQQEIVKVLDAFTKLEAELEARRKQYSHYRDKLLSFNDNIRGVVSWKTMGEIGTFVRGNGLQKKDFTDSGVGCIHYGQIYTYYGTFADKTKSFVSESFAKKMRKAHTGDLVIATTSENDEDVCKAVAWLGKDEIAISGDAYIYRHSLHPKYAAYFFQTEQFEKQKKRHISGTKVKRVSGDSMGKFLIPVPPMDEQERIVSILDKFDALVNDISEGLPAEITARRQQYEYYRNRLLTFQEAA